ncbi:TPA: hypothetical protein DCW38_01790 [candidate division WOR-3 bacterium]|uniref:T9SS type A sorting domain-containing protein n=1 Tax=candidate division WOR-3 bacterium TaxID=2052148 RepID=A0A350H8N2_UNCW3|nr:hypothetical protein [candidate division WOR-3 bacterium]
MIANDKFWVNKDYADWTVTKPLRLYWYYDNDFTVNVTDNESGTGVNGVNVAFTNEGDCEESFITDEDGNAYVNDIYTELSNWMFIYFSKEGYLPFRNMIQVNHYEFTYSGTDKTQVFKTTSFFESVKESEGLLPLQGVEVKYGNGYFSNVGYTDEIGVYRSILNVDRTNPIVVTLSKPMYKTMSYSIKPDIWTSRPVTFQESNQRNILNVPNTSILNMIYEINDTIVYGESSDFGDNWVMERVGTGRNPVFVQTSGGIVAVWNDKEVEFNYAVKASPWTPEDSLTPSICWYSEMALAKHPSTDAVYGAFINNYDEDEYGGDLMFVNWNGTDVENAELQLVKEYDYTEATSPKYSPVITNYFNKSLLLVVPSTGWISINSDFRVMNKVNNIWQEIINGYPINLSGQLCSNPTADYKLNKTTFVWQVEEDLGTSIWKREISSGTVNEPVQISSVEGMNTNARYDGGKIFAYINEECNLVDKNNTIIYESGEDKIYSMELVTKPLLTKDIVYYTWVENEGMEYLIKGMTKYYSDIAQPDFATMPTDTQTSITSSPIYEYLPKKEPVERLSYTLVGMEPEMYYEVKVVTSEGSPAKPQIIQIDGEVYGVVIGHANSVDTTVIEVPKAVYADGEITVSIDRKKGNPNRIAEILVNEYEQENDLVAVSNVIMPFKKDFGKELNETETSIKYLDKKLVFNISSDENCIKEYKVIDVTGRTVEKKTLNLKNGLNRIEVPVNIKNGIYFIKVGGVDSSYKVTVLK